MQLAKRLFLFQNLFNQIIPCFFTIRALGLGPCAYFVIKLLWIKCCVLYHIFYDPSLRRIKAGISKSSSSVGAAALTGAALASSRLSGFNSKVFAACFSSLRNGFGEGGV